MTPPRPSHEAPTVAQGRREKVLRAGLWALLVVVGAVLLLSFAGYSYDDAFITYRYSLNLAEEGRLAFNPGPATYGTSAPGYAALLGALGRLSPHPESAIPVWGSVLGMAGLLAVPLVLLAWRRGGVDRRGEPERSGRVPPTVDASKARVARGGLAADRAGGRWRTWLTVTAPLLLALRWNVEMLGGETLPALGLVALGAWLLFSEEREVAAGLALAAAAVLRLDAGLAALAFGLAWWWRQWKERRRFPLRLVLAGVLPLLAYAGWLLLHFGRLLPDTLDAKQAETIWASGSLTAAQWAWLVRTCGAWGAATLSALALAGVAAAVAAGAHRRPAFLAAAGWLLAHEVVYRAVGVPFAPWYHVATLAALVLLAGWGAAAVASWGIGRLRGTATTAGGAPDRAGRRDAVPEGGGAAITVSSPAWATALAATALLLPVWIPTAAWLADAWGTPPDPRWHVYHRVGEHLRATSQPGDAVAAVEIGFLGYSSERPVLDLMGLVSPQVVPARQRGGLAALVAAQAPRYLLDVPLFRPATWGEVLADPAVRRCYAPADRFPAPAYMGGEVVLWQRRPSPQCQRRSH